MRKRSRHSAGADAPDDVQKNGRPDRESVTLPETRSHTRAAQTAPLIERRQAFWPWGTDVVCWVRCLYMTFESPPWCRRVRWFGLLLIAACGAGSHDHKSVTQVRRGIAEPVERLAGRPQVGVLHLDRGDWSARFTISALSPPTHTYDIKIVTPARVDLAVRIHTWYGVDLGVEDSTTTDKQSCAVRGGRSVCDLLFPELEAQRAGPWTVIATDRSRSPATVRIAVTFSRACGRSNLPPCER